MAARKLQTEIDRTLKKVSEGVELFESIYDKMQASTNQGMKEKLENDLKTQIKKLQRLRDQIKTWVASNDIKDKSALLDNRKLIETQMEKFKACEKEMKTKAFSKEGLTQSAKLDPKQQEKVDTMSWVQSMIDELMVQVETAEAEIETLQVGGKKKKSGNAAAERLEGLERLNERRKWHINRLELILRLLDNGSLPTDKVLSVQDDVKYFVESNMDEEFDEDEAVYDDLNLEEEEDKFRMPNDESDSEESEEASEADLPLRTPSKKHQDEESVASSNKRDSPVLKKAATTLQQRKQSIAAEGPKPPPHANFAQQSVASMVKGPAPPLRHPPSGYAKVAAAAVAPSTSTQTQAAAAPASSSQPAVVPPTPSASTVTTSTSSIPLDQHSAVTSSPSLTHPSVTSPMLSSAASVSHQHEDSVFSAHGSPALLDAVPSSIGGPAATSSPQRPIARKASSPSPTSLQPPGVPHPSQEQSSAPVPAPNGLSQSSSAAIQSVTSSSLPLTGQIFTGTQAPGASAGASPMPHSAQPQQQPPQFPPGVPVTISEQSKMPQAPPGTRPDSAAASGLPAQMQQRANAFPGSLSDLVMSFENVKQKAPHRMSNLDQVHKLLQGSYSSMPQPQDTEKPKYYVPRNPVQTPPYYPQVPHPLLSTPGIFSQLDVETLFYVFYYHPGTYQQYLAAKELKRQSWRFHVKYLTWFQRHSEPQAITEEYEQGVYVYFDWEGSWCQRKKSDFRFEYRYLSED